MQRISKVHGPLVLTIVLMVCVALSGAFAWAEGDDNPTGTNQLQVVTAEDTHTDVGSASVPIRIYRIASASKDPNYDTYNYSFDVDAFKSLGNGFDQATADQLTYQQLADDAKELVEASGISPTATANTSAGEFETLANFDDLANGLYLVLADSVSTSTYSYSFIPAIVSLPAKVSADGMPTPMYNTSEGRWTNTDPVTPVKTILKHEEERLYGDLVITKQVENFSGEAATFVFHVYDTATNGDEYDNYATVQFIGGESDTATLPHIPAGLELTVEEDYSGARYQGTTGAQQVTIVANEEVGVGFTNTRVIGPPGHGIENSYEFVIDENSGEPDWILTPHVIDESESRPVSS